MNTTDPETEAADAGPRYKFNPNPKDAYRITMKIADAPGPFASIIGLAQYDVVNPECLPPPKVNPGEHLSPIPTEDVPIELTKISDGEYTGTVYVDRMLDEEYHKRGVCYWKLIQARVHLKATGAAEETVFIPGIAAKEFIEEETEIKYFWSGGYPRETMDDYADFGFPSPEKYKEELRDSLFTVTLIASKEAP